MSRWAAMYPLRISLPLCTDDLTNPPPSHNVSFAGILITSDYPCRFSLYQTSRFLHTPPEYFHISSYITPLNFGHRH